MFSVQTDVIFGLFIVRLSDARSVFPHLVFLLHLAAQVHPAHRPVRLDLLVLMAQVARRVQMVQLAQWDHSLHVVLVIQGFPMDLQFEIRTYDALKQTSPKNILNFGFLCDILMWMSVYPEGLVFQARRGVLEAQLAPSLHVDLVDPVVLLDLWDLEVHLHLWSQVDQSVLVVRFHLVVLGATQHHCCCSSIIDLLFHIGVHFAHTNFSKLLWALDPSGNLLIKQLEWWCLTVRVHQHVLNITHTVGTLSPKRFPLLL